MNEENVMTTNEMNREERMPFFRIPKVILTDENMWAFLRMQCFYMEFFWIAGHYPKEMIGEIRKGMFLFIVLWKRFR